MRDYYGIECSKDLAEVAFHLW